MSYYFGLQTLRTPLPQYYSCELSYRIDMCRFKVTHFRSPISCDKLANKICYLGLLSFSHVSNPCPYRYLNWAFSNDLEPQCSPRLRSAYHRALLSSFDIDYSD